MGRVLKYLIKANVQKLTMAATEILSNCLLFLMRKCLPLNIFTQINWQV